MPIDLACEAFGTEFRKLPYHINVWGNCYENGDLLDTFVMAQFLGAKLSDGFRPGLLVPLSIFKTLYALPQDIFSADESKQLKLGFQVKQLTVVFTTILLMRYLKGLNKLRPHVFKLT